MNTTARKKENKFTSTIVLSIDKACKKIPFVYSGQKGEGKETQLTRAASWIDGS